MLPKEGLPTPSCTLTSSNHAVYLTSKVVTLRIKTPEQGSMHIFVAIQNVISKGLLVPLKHIFQHSLGRKGLEQGLF